MSPSEQTDPEWSRWLVEPVAGRIADWVASGKLDESALESRLTANARAVVDARTVGDTDLPLADMESLISVLSEQLGGDSALAEWAPELLDAWAVGVERRTLAPILVEAGRLVDGAGYAAGRLSEKLMRRSDWSYTGGRAGFEVQVGGLDAASTGLLSLVGALMAGMAERAEAGFDDVRFRGVDTGRLSVFSSSRGQP